jgi:hypothetical protein
MLYCIFFHIDSSSFYKQLYRSDGLANCVKLVGKPMPDIAMQKTERLIPYSKC